MSIEDRLTAELGARAATAPPPHVEVAALERLGRHERRRRTAWGSVVAAAAVAVVVAGVSMLSPGERDSGPEPAPAPAPHGATSMPFVTGRTLHLGDRSLTIDPTWSLSHANGTTLVGRQWEGPWSLVQDDRLVQLPTGMTTPVGVILSDDGTRAAWVNTLGRTTQRVVLWDVVSGVEVARTEVSVGAGFENQLALNGIDDQGRVMWTTNTDLERVTLWRPGSDPVPVTGLPGPFERAWPGGIVAGGVLGRLSDAGAFTTLRPLADPESAQALWSPDGSVRVRWSGVGLVVETVGGSATDLPAGDLGGSTMVAHAWVSPHEVMVTGSPAGSETSSLLRCDVTTLACEVVEPALPPGVTLPDRGW